MIQDILPYTYHNEYKPRGPVPEDIVFVFRNRELLLARNDRGDMVCPRVCDLPDQPLTFLFQIEDRAYYLGEEAEPAGFSFEPVNRLRSLRPKVLAFAGMTAFHLYVWYRDNRFCGRCGHRVEHAEDERKLCCPRCGNEIFPKISPAVIVGVRDGDRIMMTRYAPGTGHSGAGNALIAGFCEIGETAEETVRREVMEEVGLHVRNIRYYKSQPWGFASNLLLGYFCDVDGSRTVRLDRQELSSARWVSRQEIGQEPEELSLTADMIMHFKREDPENDDPRLPDRIRSLWRGKVPGAFQEARGDYAVLIPLILKEDGYHILYEQRSARLAHQPGEICFPGGRLEPGESPREAALRETAEELKVHSDQLEILAELDPEMGPNGASIWPLAAVLHHYEGTWSEDEVDHVFSIPFSWFVEHEPERYEAQLVTTPGEDFPYELIPGGKEYPFRRKNHKMLFYRNDNGTIWGLTARITSNFIKKLL